MSHVTAHVTRESQRTSHVSNGARHAFGAAPRPDQTRKTITFRVKCGSTSLRNACRHPAKRQLSRRVRPETGAKC